MFEKKWSTIFWATHFLDGFCFANSFIHRCGFQNLHSYEGPPTLEVFIHCHGASFFQLPDHRSARWAHFGPNLFAAAKKMDLDIDMSYWQMTFEVQKWQQALVEIECMKKSWNSITNPLVKFRRFLGINNFVPLIFFRKNCMTWQSWNLKKKMWVPFVFSNCCSLCRNMQWVLDSIFGVGGPRTTLFSGEKKFGR